MIQGNDMKEASFVVNIVLTLALVAVTIVIYPPAILSVGVAIGYRVYEYWQDEEAQKGMKK